MQVGNKKIGIMGGGNMGEAFAGAMIQTGIFQPSFITISDIMPERLKILKKPTALISLKTTSWFLIHAMYLF
jgi:pyrroline-5-carboxylate reductase